MITPYNLTNLTSSTNIFNIISFNNEVTGYGFSYALIIAFIVFLFISLKGYDSKRAFVGTVFASTIVIMIFTALKMLPNNYLFIASIIGSGIATVLLLDWGQ